MDGCQAVKLFWNNKQYLVDGSVVKVGCDDWSNVKSFLCEKSDTDYRGELWRHAAVIFL